MKPSSRRPWPGDGQCDSAEDPGEPREDTRISFLELVSLRSNMVVALGELWPSQS